jgi:hypothetical protein
LLVCTFCCNRQQRHKLALAHADLANACRPKLAQAKKEEAVQAEKAAAAPIMVAVPAAATNPMVLELVAEVEKQEAALAKEKDDLQALSAMGIDTSAQEEAIENQQFELMIKKQQAQEEAANAQKMQEATLAKKQAEASARIAKMEADFQARIAAEDARIKVSAPAPSPVASSDPSCPPSLFSAESLVGFSLWNGECGTSSRWFFFRVV